MRLFLQDLYQDLYYAVRYWPFWETRLGQWLCERDAHSAGVEWYNPWGNDPDMRCRRCGKDLG